MDKGLNIKIRHGYVALALAFASRPRARCAVLSQYLALITSSESRPTHLADDLARGFALKLDWAEAERCIRWAEAANNHLLLWSDADYPPLLRNIPAAPSLLFVKGDKSLLSDPQVAMVGSRKASHAGLANARDLARIIGQAGFVITSGMALGIDGECHRAALANHHKTLAVLGCGIEVSYPRRHAALAGEIVAHGALISEFPLNAAPKPFHFPHRNRIISGLAVALLVVEASKKSGSLTTAIHAAEQGKEVFAVPGSVRSSGSAGCNQLISEGAQIVFNSNALLDSLAQTCRLYYPDSFSLTSPDLPELPNSAIPAGIEALNIKDKKILSLLGGDAVGFDELVTLSGLTASELSSILSALELSGLIHSLAGNAYELAL